MLVQFSVTNYKSIKDKETLDLQSCCIKEHEESLLSFSNEEKVLPVVAIYGPNGGGKSNVLEALNVLIERIRYPIYSTLAPNYIYSRSYIPQSIEPYAFSEESKEKPTEFTLFFRTQMAEYRYILYILNNRVVYESFSRIKRDTNRISSLFERNKDEIKLGREFNKFNLIDSLSDELPLLSFIGFSYKANKTVNDYVTFLLNKFNYLDFNLFTGEKHILGLLMDKKIRELFINVLKEIDTDIEDIRISEWDNCIYTKHVVNGSIYEMPLKEESSGIRNIFTIVPNILYYLINGGTIVVDDLDDNLHPLIVRYIISLFSNSAINKNKAQLIFTAHNLSIMNNEVFRRDEIYFAAKGNEQNTQLYSLIEFKDENGNVIRNDARYDKQYLEGKYGANPYIRKIINWNKL